MKKMYKVFLTINATMLLAVVYLIKEEVTIPFLAQYSVHWSFLIYFVGTICFSGICLFLSCFLSKDCIEGGITDVEPANNSYLPSYLGYFFVALSINKVSTLVWILFIIFIFTYNSQTLFFNPMFLIFRYKFYYITIENGMKIFIITKENIRTTENLKFNELRRINDYTFIDRRK